VGGRPWRPLRVVQFFEALQLGHGRVPQLRKGQSPQHLVQLILGLRLHEQHDVALPDRMPSGQDFPSDCRSFRRSREGRIAPLTMSVNRPMLSKGSALVRCIVTMYCGIGKCLLSYTRRIIGATKRHHIRRVAHLSLVGSSLERQGMDRLYSRTV